MTEVQTTLRSAYLAGPMRGYADYNFPEFHKQAAWLRANGWSVFSPAERDESDPKVIENPTLDIAGWGNGLDLAYFMSHDLKAVCETDAVIVLPGWEKSQGARLETMVAVEIGHPVFEIVVVDSSWARGRVRGLVFVEPSRIAAEFIAGTVAHDDLPTVEPRELSGAEVSALTDEQLIEGFRAARGFTTVSQELCQGIGKPRGCGDDCACQEQAFPTFEVGDVDIFEVGALDEPAIEEWAALVTGSDSDSVPRDAEGLPDDGWDIPEKNFFEGLPAHLMANGGEQLADEAMRQFDTGATRNLETDPDIYGFTSPLALGLFAEYMHAHRTQADGTLRDSDNWKKGIPPDSYMRSMRRHLQDLTLHHDGYGHLAREDIVAAMAGLFFNVQGYMHEYVKGGEDRAMHEAAIDALASLMFNPEETP